MTSDDYLLEIHNISKSFSGKDILNDISFSVNRGDFFGIIGPNGAGKSTLLDIMVTLTEKSGGNIRFKGSDVGKEKKYYRSRIGYVPQDICCYQDLTAYENMRYFANIYGCPSHKAKKMIDDLLSIVNLEESKHTLCKKLSGGMQRRLNIACSLVHDPELIILDEPVANLDHHQREDIWHLLSLINKSGKTIIISSHLLHDVNRMCNKVAFIFDGRTLFYGTPDELQSNFNQNFLVHLRTTPGNYKLILSSLRPVLTINEHNIENNNLIMNITNTNYAVHQMVHILDSLSEYIIDIDIDKPSLDDTFEEIIKRFEK